MLLLWVVALWAALTWALRSWMYRPFSLDDKVVVITGAGMGIGRRLAEKIYLTASNVTLVLLDINQDALEKTQRHLQELGKKSSTVRIYQCDVSDESAVERCIQQVIADVAPHPIAVLVNNAGIVSGKSIMELTPSQVRRTFGVNLFAHFWLVKSVLPSMKQSDDAMIVSIASVLGFTGGARLSDYVASKSAVIGFHDCLRLELLHDQLRHIRTLLVCPLGIRTGMFDGLFDSDHGLFNLQRIFAPMLTENEVVESIHGAMLRGEHQVVSCHPGWLGTFLAILAPITRVIPPVIRDQLSLAVGAVHGMDTFVGHGSKKKATE
ncbi:hypothetical protein Poli38472_010610 [Pythium oligandrum]|uniref:Ketoreductase domain-containing protein n=1 Tax=Pythium oligandrum TaxID=41045 RepID=A0A8K1C3E8_PYTOL|nr:hypothetical protein Poli38472_010610 [Pythium oligandrum]|eukprot:TMW55728.1 hypothetical protein Poli38472_010610 [Pythium oligandrum]